MHRLSHGKLANLFVGSPSYRPSRARFSLEKRHARRTFSLSGGAWGSMEESIFQQYLGTRTIFKMDREILRPSYLPDRLPHRESHIGQLAQILVTALKGERPSNVLIFGKTGTGKTAVVKYIENEFRKADGARMVQYLYLNCEIVDTPYGVLQSIGNKFIENFHQRIPFTGLSTDRVYSLLLEKLDEEKRVVIVALDEIDKLVQKNGDDILYQLLKINDDLSKARVSLIGISNNLKFTEYLDPRVRSRLADEKMVFPPYNADELYDILSQRSRLAFEIGNAKLTTGEVYTTYRDLCRKTGVSPLTQRRVTDLISELDMLGLVHARVRSFGRGGRTKEIQASVPALDVKKVLEKDEILAEARGYRLKVQTTLL